MGFSNGDDLNMADSFNTKKLRPLIPRPAITATTTTTSSPYAIHTHGTGDFFPLQDHLGAPEQGKRQLSDHQVSSRWNPTPEQLQVLEDLYRRGIHTPSAEQIRNITTQLRRFGKIEGKNVFYWFQNHKARERQKRRRQTEESIIRSHCNVEILGRKETDSSGRGFQVEGCKSWLSATNCNINVEEPASTYRAEWLHQHQSLREMHDTWHLGSLSSPPDLMNMINSNPSLATAVAAATLSKPKIIINEDYSSVDDEERGQSQTLDLFPVRSDGSVFEEKTQVPASPPMMTLTPCHFFEFL